MAELTTEDVARLIVEVQTGKPANVGGPEAEKMLTLLRAEQMEMRDQGGIVDLPGEVG